MNTPIRRQPPTIWQPTEGGPAFEDVKLSRSVKGKVVLVTGAASGMGRATARVFADEGAYVAVTDLKLEDAQRVVDGIVESGGKAKAYALDVGKAQTVANVVREIGDSMGGLDIVINNAGISRRISIDSPDFDESWELTVNILLTAQQRVIRAALPYLRRSDAPRIVNIASTEALGATAGNASYAAAKAGVTGLTRSLAVELGPEGITVNCICPGPIDTAMVLRVPVADKQKYARRRTALHRYGLAVEVAHMTLSLCLPAASFLTGVTIPVDGGLMARNG